MHILHNNGKQHQNEVQGCLQSPLLRNFAPLNFPTIFRSFPFFAAGPAGPLPAIIAGARPCGLTAATILQCRGFPFHDLEQVTGQRHAEAPASSMMCRMPPWR